MEKGAVISVSKVLADFSHEMMKSDKSLNNGFYFEYSNWLAHEYNMDVFLLRNVRYSSSECFKKIVKKSGHLMFISVPVACMKDPGRHFRLSFA
jgi:hypothetical protein